MTHPIDATYSKTLTGLLCTLFHQLWADSAAGVYSNLNWKTFLQIKVCCPSMQSQPFDVLWNDCLSLTYNKQHWIAAQREIDRLMHSTEDSPTPTTIAPTLSFSSTLMEAVSKIYTILEPLTPEERIRVIKATCILLGIPFSKLEQS